MKQIKVEGRGLGWLELTFPEARTNGKFRDSVYDTETDVLVGGLWDIVDGIGWHLYLADLARHGPERVRKRMTTRSLECVLWRGGNVPGVMLSVDDGVVVQYDAVDEEPESSTGLLALPQIVADKGDFAEDAWCTLDFWHTDQMSGAWLAFCFFRDGEPVVEELVAGRDFEWLVAVDAWDSLKFAEHNPTHDQRVVLRPDLESVGPAWKADLAAVDEHVRSLGFHTAHVQLRIMLQKYGDLEVRAALEHQNTLAYKVVPCPDGPITILGLVYSQ